MRMIENCPRCNSTPTKNDKWSCGAHRSKDGQIVFGITCQSRHVSLIHEEFCESQFMVAEAVREIDAAQTRLARMDNIDAVRAHVRKARRILGSVLDDELVPGAFVALRWRGSDASD